jgi:hypothetical protein
MARYSSLSVACYHGEPPVLEVGWKGSLGVCGVELCSESHA